MNIESFNKKKVIEKIKRQLHKKREFDTNAYENTTFENRKKDFKDNIKIQKKQDENRIILLQQKFMSGNIKEEDISEEDVEKLHGLYDEQINRIQELIEIYKTNIIKLKKLS